MIQDTREAVSRPAATVGWGSGRRIRWDATRPAEPTRTTRSATEDQTMIRWLRRLRACCGRRGEGSLCTADAVAISDAAGGSGVSDVPAGAVGSDVSGGAGAAGAMRAGSSREGTWPAGGQAAVAVLPAPVAPRPEGSPPSGRSPVPLGSLSLTEPPVPRLSWSWLPAHTRGCILRACVPRARSGLVGGGEEPGPPEA